MPVTALGVRDALGVVLPVVNHRLLVPRLLLQREDDAADVHVTDEEQEIVQKGNLLMLPLPLCAVIQTKSHPLIDHSQQGTYVELLCRGCRFQQFLLLIYLCFKSAATDII